MIERLIIYSPDAFQPYGHCHDYVRGLGGALRREGIAVVVVGWDGDLELPQLEEQRVRPLRTLRLRSEYRQRYGLVGDALWGVGRVRDELELLDALVSRAGPVGPGDALLYESFEYMALARHLGRVERRCPSVGILHDTNFNLRHASPVAAAYKLLVRRYVRRSVRRLDATFVHGENMRKNLLRNLGGGPELAARVAVISYGAPGPDEVQSIERAAARKPLGIDPDALVMLAFGTLRSDKRLDALLAGLAYAPGWMLLVAGPEGDVTYEEFLKMARDAGVADRVRIDRGFVTAKNQPPYFGAADVVVALYGGDTHHESGTAQLARSYQRPIIAGGAADLQRYVTRHGVGWVVDPDAPVSFGEAAVEARRYVERGDAALLARLRDCAEARSWSAVARRLLDELQRVEGGE